MQSLLQDSVTLMEGGTQLKAIWQKNQGWPTGVEALREVASRLALLGHIMGEVPVLSCASGQDYTRQLQSEVKLLATLADNERGYLPTTPRNSPEWDAIRAEYMRSMDPPGR